MPRFAGAVKVQRLDLHGRVRHAEGAQDDCRFDQRRATVGLIGNRQVHAQGIFARGNGPGVQVVNLGDDWNLLQAARIASRSTP